MLRRQWPEGGRPVDLDPVPVRPSVREAGHDAIEGLPHRGPSVKGMDGSYPTHRGA